MSSGRGQGLMLVTDRSQCRGALVEVCDQALGEGFAAIMLREKDLGGRALFDLAGELQERTRARGVPLIVNDRLDVALALPDAGAHIGTSGIPVRSARALLGPERILGYSAHDPKEAQKAIDDGADYTTVSPIFSSASKPGLKPQGMDLLVTAVRSLGERVVALGGIDRLTLPEVAVSGVGGAAIMGAVMRAEDPTATARELVRLWTAGRETAGSR